jgi:hypothetical protein
MCSDVTQLLMDVEQSTAPQEAADDLHTDELRETDS